MDVWRLTRKKHRDHALNGIGARLTGNRWNSRGTAIAYAAISLELAVLESMMHLSLDQIPTDYIWLRYDVPDDAVTTLQQLPAGWDKPAPYEANVQAIGDEWVRSGRSLGLVVPAAVLPVRQNVLINPSHDRFGDVTLKESDDFTWPSRLLTRLTAL